MDVYGLRPLKNAPIDSPEEEDFSEDYRDDDFDPRITNEFAAASYRIGHTMIPNAITLRDPQNPRNYMGALTFRGSFFNVDYLHEEGGIDRLLTGAALQHARTVDRFINKDVKNSMIQSLSM